MEFTLTLMGLSLYLLIWEKLPDWGSWFNRLVAALPRPLAYLYQAWRCPYCFGFWAALALHGLTGHWTLPALAESPAYLGPAGPAIAWFLDALATALLIMAGKLMLSAIAVPAIKGHQMTEQFRAAMKEAA
ncbi:hypothetical protein [Gallaecimonas sp. GXIMD4217]|uniref:hypothetical protein n=1 Tax=Gallaecimonas sp. GXIMD4217 TaxID=3131927 RepID=UPI00311ABEDF